jgi:hypothetical protein
MNTPARLLFVAFLFGLSSHPVIAQEPAVADI